MIDNQKIINRRQLISSIGVCGSATLAGCSGLGLSDEGISTSESSGTTEEPATPGHNVPKEFIPNYIPNFFIGIQLPIAIDSSEVGESDPDFMTVREAQNHLEGNYHEDSYVEIDDFNERVPLIPQVSRTENEDYYTSFDADVFWDLDLLSNISPNELELHFQIEPESAGHVDSAARINADGMQFDWSNVTDTSGGIEFRADDEIHADGIETDGLDESLPPTISIDDPVDSTWLQPATVSFEISLPENEYGISSVPPADHGRLEQKVVIPVGGYEPSIDPETLMGVAESASDTLSRIDSVISASPTSRSAPATEGVDTALTLGLIKKSDIEGDQKTAAQLASVDGVTGLRWAIETRDTGEPDEYDDIVRTKQGPTYAWNGGPHLFTQDSYSNYQYRGDVIIYQLYAKTDTSVQNQSEAIYIGITRGFDYTGDIDLTGFEITAESEEGKTTYRSNPDEQSSQHGQYEILPVESYSDDPVIRQQNEFYEIKLPTGAEDNRLSPLKPGLGKRARITVDIRGELQGSENGRLSYNQEFHFHPEYSNDAYSLLIPVAE